MRIAQMVVAKYERIQFKLVGQLTDSKRGSGGFGSTGTK
jgi:dUTP pyrophosphatase